MPESSGDKNLRAENISKVVTGFALKEYKMKQLCLIQSSNAWTETYYTETAADIRGHKYDGTNYLTKGIPRMATFPEGKVVWEKVKGRNVKHGLQQSISWEDAKTDAIDVIARTLLRIARAVTQSVDEVIAAAILADAGNTTAANATWNNSVIANRDPIQDILDGISEIESDNYDASRNAYLLVHPTNKAELLGNANVRNAGQFYTDAVTRNGVVGKLLGLTVISSTSVTEGGAQIVIGKEACTWKSVVGLTVKTIEDPGVKYTIRAWEVGQIQVVNPNAICTITGV